MYGTNSGDVNMAKWVKLENTIRKKHALTSVERIAVPDLCEPLSSGDVAASATVAPVVGASGGDSEVIGNPGTFMGAGDVLQPPLGESGILGGDTTASPVGAAGAHTIEAEAGGGAEAEAVNSMISTTSSIVSAYNLLSTTSRGQ